ncbi:TPA: hypothetical protein KOO21_003809, partial [Clostridioides difficile]|nr:hypothetical protein [Clostridioides difficile]
YIGDTGRFRGCIFGSAYGYHKIPVFCFILFGTIQRGRRIEYGTKSFSEWYYSASSSRVIILFGYLTGKWPNKFFTVYMTIYL